MGKAAIEEKEVLFPEEAAHALYQEAIELLEEGKYQESTLLLTLLSHLGWSGEGIDRMKEMAYEGVIA